MDILQICRSDEGGGAEKIARQLVGAFEAAGVGSWLAVARRMSRDPDVLPVPWAGWKDPGPQLRAALEGALARRPVRVPGVGRIPRLLGFLGSPKHLSAWWRGEEDFHFPGAWRLLRLPPRPPTILHCHNLHGGYFDLTALPWLSQQVPLVLTLHDAWLLTGHCAHPFRCERWKTGCGRCPDLTIPPRIRRDSTVGNWRRKREVYARSRLFVTTPSQWLMDRVARSILGNGLLGSRVIPNGVDLRTFHPGDGKQAREELGIPQGARVLLFVANGVRKNVWKDYETMRAVVGRLAHGPGGRGILFAVLGEAGPGECMGTAEVRFLPHRKDPATVALHYQAADLYLHAARADTFPNTVLEALACGTPVVATAVGGIPEQVRGLDLGGEAAGLNSFSREGATGVLVPQGDAREMAMAVSRLLDDDELRARLGENAACDARDRFGVDRQAKSYLAWYEEARERWERALAMNPGAPREVPAQAGRP
jgi:glycosyltransferase involved in cell wall biosynthesis